MAAEEPPGLQHASGGGMGVGFTELMGSKSTAVRKASVPIALEGSADLPLLALGLGQSF